MPTYGCYRPEDCLGRDVMFVRGDGRGGWQGVSIHRAEPVTGKYTKGSEGCTGQSIVNGAQYPAFKVGELATWDRFPILEERHGTASDP